MTTESLGDTVSAHETQHGSVGISRHTLAVGCSAGMAALVLSALPPAATPLSAPLMPAQLSSAALPSRLMPSKLVPSTLLPSMSRMLAVCTMLPACTVKHFLWPGSPHTRVSISIAYESLATSLTSPWALLDVTQLLAQCRTMYHGIAEERMGTCKQRRTPKERDRTQTDNMDPHAAKLWRERFT